MHYTRVCVTTGTPTSHCRNSEKVKTADEHIKLINNVQTLHCIKPESANSFANEFCNKIQYETIDKEITVMYYSFEDTHFET